MLVAMALAASPGLLVPVETGSPQSGALKRIGSSAKGGNQCRETVVLQGWRDQKHTLCSCVFVFFGWLHMARHTSESLLPHMLFVSQEFRDVP